MWEHGERGSGVYTDDHTTLGPFLSPLGASGLAGESVPLVCTQIRDPVTGRERSPARSLGPLDVQAHWFRVSSLFPQACSCRPQATGPGLPSPTKHHSPSGQRKQRETSRTLSGSKQCLKCRDETVTSPHGPGNQL